MKGLDEIIACLPEAVANAVKHQQLSADACKLSEIRLRAGNLQTLVVSGKELVISSLGRAESDRCDPLRLSATDLSEVVFRLCDGSVYAHFDELRCGFISKNGTRIGVCGNGILKNGIPSGFSSYSSLNIRIPRHIPESAVSLLEHIKKYGSGHVGGVLAISPPGCGKTTFLRAVSSALSQGYFDKEVFTRKRVCIIDERGEFKLDQAYNNGLADFISFLPKAYSIEVATRVLSPEYIVCDEIGNNSDAVAIRDGATKGVLFIASCHGTDLSDILQKKTIRALFDDGIFSTACELSVKNGKFLSCVRTFSQESGKR